jgi:histone deacetylase 6
MSSSLSITSAAVIDYDGFEFGAVSPLDDCSHIPLALSSSSLPLPPLDFDSTSCAIADCPNSFELWLCLTCSKCFCGRFCLGHSSSHSAHEENQHSLVLSLADLSIWCYQCDSYIHPKADQTLTRIHREVYKLKFGQEAPSTNIDSSSEERQNNTDVQMILEEKKE